MKPNIGQLMRQAQQLQANMQKAQEQLAALEVTGESGGGMVKVVMNGRHEVRRVEIDPAAAGSDREMLEDLVAAACNDATRRVGEAVQQFKGERPAEEEVDVKIDLPVDAHLPHDYIGVERLRLEMYRKLASARSAAELDEAVVEMRDRYGEPPLAVANLVAVARFRLVARSYGLTDVSVQGKHVRFAPLALPDAIQRHRSDRGVG